MNQLVLIFITSTLSVIYGADVMPNNAAVEVSIPANMVTTAELELTLRQIYDNLAQLSEELTTTRAELALAKETNQAHEAKIDEFNLDLKATKSSEKSTAKTMVEDIQKLQKKFKDLMTIMNQFTHRMTLFEARNEENTYELNEKLNTMMSSVDADIRTLQEDSKRRVVGFQTSAIEWLSSTYDQGVQIMREKYPKIQRAVADKSSMMQQMIEEGYPKIQQAVADQSSKIQRQIVHPIMTQVQNLYQNHAKVMLDQAKPLLEANVRQAQVHWVYVKTDVLPKATSIFLTTRKAIMMKTEVHLSSEMKPYSQVMVDFILTLLAAPLILILLLQLLVLARGMVRMIMSVLSCCFCCCCRRRQKSLTTVQSKAAPNKKIITKTNVQSKAAPNKKIITKPTKSRKYGH